MYLKGGDTNVLILFFGGLYDRTRKTKNKK